MLVNSVFFLLIINLYFFAKNLFKIMRGERIFEGFEHEPLWKRLLAMTIGYRVHGNVDWKFFRVIEKRIDEKKFFDFFKLNSELNSLDGKVWVTPVVPFVTLMFLGFMFSLLFGDFLTILIFKISGVLWIHI